jgi:hypothetical protein
MTERRDVVRNVTRQSSPCYGGALHSSRLKSLPNILIVGSESAADIAVQGISPLLAGPAETCVLPGPLRLPRENCAAFILRNVEALNPEQQTELLDWLESGPRVPVVSVSSSSLFVLVANGRFCERLYYRLNVILDAADPEHHPSSPSDVNHLTSVAASKHCVCGDVNLSLIV